MANGRCRNHGGKSTGPKFLKAGGYHSVNFPGKLKERYQQAEDDPELTSVRRHLALGEALIIEKLESISSEPLAEIWSQLADAFKKAITGKDKNALRRVGELIAQGNQRLGDEKQVRELMQEQGKLAKVENERLMKLGSFITAEGAMTLVTMLSDSVNKHVTNPSERDAIKQDLIRAINREPGGQNRIAS